MMSEREMKLLEELWKKDPDLTEEEAALMEQLNIEYDAEFGYFEED